MTISPDAFCKASDIKEYSELVTNGKKWNMVTNNCNIEYDMVSYQRLWRLNANNPVFQSQLLTICWTLNQTIQHSNTQIQIYNDILLVLQVLHAHRTFKALFLKIKVKLKNCWCHSMPCLCIKTPNAINATKEVTNYITAVNHFPI